MFDTEELTKESAHLSSILEHITKEIAGASNSAQPTRDYTQMVLNTLREQERIQLEKSLSQPYFSKVIFQEHGRKRKEEAYIGRFGLFDRATLTPLVIDWRSPIANLYYDDSFDSVPVSIDQANELYFDVERKRQFEIKTGRLLNYFDSTNAAGVNQLLIERLESKSDQKLKDIVETIQSDQNRIIRADAKQVMLVQGVAGSGKTTIALHRLSYLAYQYRERSSFNNFLIIAPNRLFIDYISDVLPELGVEGMVQTTWEALIRDLLPKKLRLNDHQVKISAFFEGRAGNERFSAETITLASRVRGSMAMKQLLDKIIVQFVNRMIPVQDLVLDKAHVLSHSEIHKKFHEDFRHYPYMQRRARLVQTLTRFAQDCMKEATTEWEKRLVKGRYLEITERIQRVKEKYRAALESYCQKVKSVDVLALYRRIITNQKNIAWVLKRLEPQIDPLQADLVCAYLQEVQTGPTIDQEDLASLLYITHVFYGLEKGSKFSHIIVDEAQDLEPFQLYVLSLLNNQVSMSIFGDLSQSIYPFKGLTSWEALQTGVFTAQTSYCTLTQSYRSTIEIMSYANHVIAHWENPHKILAVPVIRHGEEPATIVSKSEKALSEDLMTLVANLQAEGFRNIALIDKTKQDCRDLQKRLGKMGADYPILTEKDTHYKGGVNILPIYFSKGMEFDAVILVDPTIKKFDPGKDADIKLLYVALTRALHRLVVVCHQAPTPLLPVPAQS